MNGLSIILLFVSCCITCSRETTLSDSACYGTDPRCDYYSLSCDNSTVIRLQDLNVGYKPADVCMPATHCNNSGICCSKSMDDIVELFNIKNTFDAYNNCSGKQVCDNVQAPWQQIRSINKPSTYVHMEYTCVKETDILNFCGSRSDGTAISKTGAVVDVKFDSRKPNTGTTLPNNCTCTVASENGAPVNVTMKVIDIRLHSYTTTGNQSQQYECSTSNFTSEVYVKTCTNSTMHHDDNFENNGMFTWEVTTESAIFLYDIYKLGNLDAPAMVWFTIEATDRLGNLSVTCNEYIPVVTTTTETPSTISTTTLQTTSTQPVTSTKMSSTMKSSTMMSSTMMSSTMMSSTSTSTPSVTSSVSSSTRGSTQSADPLTADEEGDNDNRIVFLAIFIPIGFFMILTVLCIVRWKCDKRKKGGRRLHYLDNGNAAGYNHDSKILDNFIYDITKMDIVDPDNPAVYDTEREAIGRVSTNPIYVPDGTDQETSFTIHTKIPLRTVSATVPPQHMQYASNNLSFKLQDSPFARNSAASETYGMVSAQGGIKNGHSVPTLNGSIVNAKQNVSNPQTAVNHPRQSGAIIKEDGDAIVISVYDAFKNEDMNGLIKDEAKDTMKQSKHGDSTVSAKDDNPEAMKPAQSVIEQTTGGGVVIHVGRPENNTPSSRALDNSSPAIIVPESVEERRSGTAFILPGRGSGDDATVLFVNNPGKGS